MKETPLKNCAITILVAMITWHIITIAYLDHFYQSKILSTNYFLNFRNSIIFSAICIFIIMSTIIYIFKIKIGDCNIKFNNKCIFLSFGCGVISAWILNYFNWLSNSLQLRMFIINFALFYIHHSIFTFLYLIFIILIIPILLEIVFHKIYLNICSIYFGNIMSIIILGMIYLYFWNLLGYYTSLSLYITTGLISCYTKSVKYAIIVNCTIIITLILMELYHIQRIYYILM